MQTESRKCEAHACTVHRGSAERRGERESRRVVCRRWAWARKAELPEG